MFSVTHHEKGFSVVETLAALCVMGIIASTLALGLVGQAHRNKNTQEITAAVLVAQKVLDDLRSRPLSDIDPDNDFEETFPNEEMSGFVFQVEATFCENGSLCAGNSMKQVKIDVSRHGESKYVVETVFSAFD